MTTPAAPWLAEERERHERLQHGERHRARVVEKLVAREEVDPQAQEPFQPFLHGSHLPQKARR
jgi:hypothetical protein